MRKFNRKQQGITFLGFLIVLAIIGLVVFLALRLYPLYYEKFQVLNAMKGAASQPNAETMPKAELRRLFLRNLTATTNIDRFNKVNIKNFLQVKSAKKNEPKKLVMSYEIRGPFFQDIELVMNFNQEVPIGQARAGGE
ncbi:MAG: DUF4845 domain-containing protein [Gammaproteobacteria bacterium]|nr:DUF4845 domain-containing protein [Gammaproteobacteria bacterium]